jgi:hypothetical protein
MKLRVKDNEKLVRDSSTLAILNTDVTAIDFHQKKMEKIQKDQAREKELNNLKLELSEIRQMLADLIQQSSAQKSN